MTPKRLKKVQIAIDGPAGVGKTTTARTLARDLGFLYIDTGAMYRALAVWARQSGVSLDDPEATAALARKAQIQLKPAEDGGLRVRIEGRDLTKAIRTAEASDGASRISVHPGVRQELVRQQRRLAGKGGVVMEGRDIGTVVLPGAEAKVFLTASAEERARRRHRELAAKQQDAGFERVLEEILARDARDRGRAASPLEPAPDAVVLDCTAFDATSQIAVVRRIVETLIQIPKPSD